MTPDPTRNERQRLYRARRKAADAGRIEVTVGASRYWVSAKTAEKIERLCAPSNVTQLRRKE